MRANRIIARIRVRYWEWSRVRGASRPQPILLTHLRNDSCSRVGMGGQVLGTLSHHRAGAELGCWS